MSLVRTAKRRLKVAPAKGVKAKRVLYMLSIIPTIATANAGYRAPRKVTRVDDGVVRADDDR